ncbi:P-loop containing nucleoside triphosphate hydrolase protein [Athelia psychrophila]|uniref:DNA 3'-5' helicase n=1 Tax=Athelia psychrophila TaxID=1759441 RepID=A0A167W3A8_9AGAM|nr:P-loop containing nucleoside triphosphate hydrolase protein [Fibularhizoctonia sp. CBS 109695]
MATPLAPKGTRHRLKRPRNSKPPPQDLPERKPLTTKDMEGLEDLIKAQFGWEDGPQEFQMQAIRAQLMGKDVLLHAKTGSGKTGVVAGPFVHPSTAGKVSIMVSPLLSLHEEQASKLIETFQKEFKLKAVAVNSRHGGCNQNVLNDIVAGKWQIVLISPEMLLSKRFIREVLKNPQFGKRVFSVAIDEAHVVSHWGSEFRKKYGTLGMIRAFLPRGTPVVAVSATLAARVRNDVLAKLQFGRDFVSIDIGNDRPNVSIIVRSIQHPMNTYADLDFVVGEDPQVATDLDKGFIYADDINEGIRIQDHLAEILPPHLRSAGLIRPYNAAHSREYLEKVMMLFRRGVVRILVCTDAAGMGCNIPDIDFVVQWKLPASTSTFVQRAGRTARGRDRTGWAVLLVEPSAYKVDPSAEDADEEVAPTSQKTSKGKGKPRRSGRARKLTKQKGKGGKVYTNACGIRRGARDGKHDMIFVREQPIIDPEGLDEGLYVLAQTGKCRRAVLTEIYQNKTPSPTVPCCDLCCPELLNKTRPGIVLPAQHQARIMRGQPYMPVQIQLNAWRFDVRRRDFTRSMFDASGILKDESLELLSSVGPFPTRKRLSDVLAGQWKWEERYGDELFELLTVMDIPPMKRLPTKPRGTKRVVEEESDGEGTGQKKRTRRAVTNSAQPALEPVCFVGGSQSVFALEGYTHPRNSDISESSPLPRSLDPSANTFPTT